MGLIKFLFYRKKEQSVLASKKYGEKQSKIEDLNKIQRFITYSNIQIMFRIQ